MWQDLLVGGLAIGLGTLALGGAYYEWEMLFRVGHVRRVERRWGRRTARIFAAAVGSGLIALGCFIALGGGP